MINGKQESVPISSTQNAIRGLQNRIDTVIFTLWIVWLKFAFRSFRTFRNLDWHYKVKARKTAYILLIRVSQYTPLFILK